MKMYKVEFESSVNSDGTQTKAKAVTIEWLFESSVNSDGTQTETVRNRWRS